MARLFDFRGVLGEGKMADFSKNPRGVYNTPSRIEDGRGKCRPEMPFSRLLTCLGA